MQKKHYYICCAQVAWRSSEESEDLQMAPINTIMSLSQPFIRQFNLSQLNGQAINNLSMMIGERINPDLVASVTILSISSLGYMTEDEFTARPSQMQVEQEVRGVIANAKDQNERA